MYWRQGDRRRPYHIRKLYLLSPRTSRKLFCTKNLETLFSKRYPEQRSFLLNDVNLWVNIYIGYLEPTLFRILYHFHTDLLLRFSFYRYILRENIFRFVIITNTIFSRWLYLIEIFIFRFLIFISIVCWNVSKYVKSENKKYNEPCILISNYE